MLKIKIPARSSRRCRRSRSEPSVRPSQRETSRVSLYCVTQQGQDTANIRFEATLVVASPLFLCRRRRSSHQVPSTAGARMQPGGEPWRSRHTHTHTHTGARARTFIIEARAVIIIKRCCLGRAKG